VAPRWRKVEIGVEIYFFSVRSRILISSMQDVTIPFGENASIVGKTIDSYVNRFTGIPFALPPVGDLRWKLPRKLPTDFFQKLDKPYDATQFKSLCLQPPSPLPHDPGQHADVIIPH
jgi:hypothetical protein